MSAHGASLHLMGLPAPMGGLTLFHCLSTLSYRYPPTVRPPVGEAIKRVEGDVFLRAVTRKDPLAQGRRGPDMNRNSTRLLLLVAATLFFSSAFPNPALAQTISFIAGGDYAAGANPSSVAVGDFNGDGRPDLAVA